MRQVKIVLGMVMTGLLLGVSYSSLALSRQGYLMVTPSVGYFRYADKRDIDSEVLPTISIGFGFTEAISGELFYAGLSSKLKNNSDQNIEGDLLALNGLYHFRIGTVLQPYVTAGVGAIQLNPPAPADAKVQANLNAGGGLEYGFSDRLSLRVGARDFYTMVGGKNDWLIDCGLTINLWKFL